MFFWLVRVLGLSWVMLGIAAGFALANNAFNPGTILSGTSGTETGTTVGATSETGEPAGIGGGSVNSIWYRWTAPASGTAIFGTCNLTSETTTNHDTTLHVYTGNAVNALTLVTSNDDTTGCNSTVNVNYGSWVQFAATSGVTYHIRVDGYASATGGYVMRWGLRGVTVNVTDASATEGGDTAAFTVVLTAPPSGSSAVTVAIGTSTQCSFAPASLSFTSANFTTPQTVTVTAINDVVAEGTHSCSPASVTATGTGYTTTTATPPTLTVYDNDNPSFTISKSVSSASIAAPGTLTYTITVDNNGSAILTGLSISDSLTQNGSARTLSSGPTLTSGDSNSDGILQDTETWVYTATYAVTQANIDTGGSFSNTATFDTAETAPQTSAAAVTTITQSPSFTILKGQSGGPDPVTAQGQTITWLITIDNTGNVSLTGLSLSDALTQAGSPRSLTSGPTYSSGDSDSDGAIDPDEIWLYSASYTVTLSDMDNGGTFSNTATLDTAQTVAVTSAAETTAVTQSPALSIDKQFTFTVDNGTPNRADVGDVIAYTYDVTNTGNVTISNVSVSDAHSGSGPPPVPSPALVASLAPAATVQFSASYTVTQADVDAQ